MQTMDKDLETIREAMAKILVAMSGGVDSSLTAVLLHQQGHEVTGVTLHLWEVENEDSVRESQCCSQEMVAGARRVCAQFGLPFYVFNYQREFRSTVIQYFIDEYARGVTPNPCLVCNRDVKFRFLLERAQALGFDYVATGHYAQIVPDFPDETGSGYALLRGKDHAKDQSYVLYMLGQKELAHIMFPLGGLTKAEVRALAREHGLATADRPESQDICFVPDNNYRHFLQQERPEVFTPGPIVDQEGREIGAHQGLPNYTVGQRKGLGICTPEALFVTEIDTARNALVVGPAAAARQRHFVAEQVSFVSGHWPEQPFTCQVQIRIHSTPGNATVVPLDREGEPGKRRVQVTFDQPQRAITPGQAAVFYADERVLGGGYISSPRDEGATTW